MQTFRFMKHFGANNSFQWPGRSSLPLSALVSFGARVERPCNGSLRSESMRSDHWHALRHLVS